MYALFEIFSFVRFFCLKFNNSTKNNFEGKNESQLQKILFRRKKDSVKTHNEKKKNEKRPHFRIFEYEISRRYMTRRDVCMQTGINL